MLLWQQRPACANLKPEALFSGRICLVLLFLVSLGFSGCRDDRNFCPEPATMACTTEVTVKGAICGVGIWGGKWLQLDNGEYLQPWESPLNLPGDVQVGQRFRISYEEITRDSRYSNQVICMAVPPASKAIRILCLEEAGLTACSMDVTVEKNSCFPGYWGDVWLKKANGELLLPWDGMPLPQPLADGQRLRIGYQTSAAVKTFNPNCIMTVMPPPAERIEVTCVEVLAPATGNCSVIATAENRNCFAGAWGATWLRLADGSLLQPWQTDVSLPDGLVAGRHYRLGYEVIALHAFYDPLALCNVALPPATAIRVNCIQEETPLTTQSGK